MSNLVQLTACEHQSLHLDPNKCGRHGSHLNMIPVVLSEFRKLITQYPIVLTKNGDTGAFTFVALLGFAEGRTFSGTMMSGAASICHCRSADSLSSSAQKIVKQVSTHCVSISIAQH